MEESIPDLVDGDLLKSEFGHLKGSCYLDQTGTALYTKSQVEAVTADLVNQLYGNPHSKSLAARLSEDTVDQVRYRILQHFNTESNEYSIIFTSGATEALKIVAETFDFTGNGSGLQFTDSVEGESTTSLGEFVYLQDNHTSVLGMRNVDNITLRKVSTRSISQSEAFQALTDEQPSESNHSGLNGLSSESCEVESKNKTSEDIPISVPQEGNSLFVFPAQCNFSGLKYPLSWISKVQKGTLQKKDNYSRCKWFCLLDAATYVSTNPLDLSSFKPDFVSISFYKMFGLPTGLGALLVRNTSATVLQKRYYGGGTVLMTLASKPLCALRPVLHQRFEDGTNNFLSIIALRHGLDWLQRLSLKMHSVSLHVYYLARYTHNRLRMLHHANSCPAVCIYADTAFDNPNTQGGIVNFNMCRDSGDFVGFTEVLALANLHGIHLRTGCFCNPGACQRLLGISDEQYCKNFEAGHVCGDDKDLIAGRPTGSVRVSFGPHSRQSDVDRLVDMLTECFVAKPAVYKEPENWKERVKVFHQKFKGAVYTSSVNENQTGFTKVTNCEKLQFVKKDEMLDNSKLVQNGSSISERSESDRLRNQPVVSQICLYPVKSCGALRVDQWPMDHRGLRYDRRWMVVTEAGVALTQKQHPHLCLVQPLIDLDKGVLTLTCKGFPSCSLSLEPPAGDAVSPAWLCQSKVCGDNVQGVDCGEAAASWLALVLRTNSIRLLRQSDHSSRSEGSVSSLALSNQAQFLLVNENSVAWLSDKLPADSDCLKINMVDRFRSNFVIKGCCPAFEEQNWKKVQIGNVNFKVNGPCGRCQMICIDQSTGVRTKEPLTTLAANCQGRMKFGIYLTRENSERNVIISVGDQIISFT